MVVANIDLTNASNIGYRVIDDRDFKITITYPDHVEEKVIPVRINGAVNPDAMAIVNYIKSIKEKKAVTTKAAAPQTKQVSSKADMLAKIEKQSTKTEPQKKEEKPKVEKTSTVSRKYILDPVVGTMVREADNLLYNGKSKEEVIDILIEKYGDRITPKEISEIVSETFKTSVDDMVERAFAGDDAPRRRSILNSRIIKRYQQVIEKNDTLEKITTMRKKKEGLSTDEKQAFFMERTNEITEEEYGLLKKYFKDKDSTRATKIALINIMSKYGFTAEELLTAFMIIGKKKEQQAAKVVKSDRYSDRIERKMEALDRSLVSFVKSGKYKDPALVSTELKRLSREYDVSSKSLELLLEKAKKTIITESYDKKARKVLTGRKLPSEYRPINQKIEELIPDKDVGLVSKEQMINSAIHLVSPAYVEDWKQYVEQNYRNPVPLGAAINVMKMVHNRQSMSEVRHYLKGIHNSFINVRQALEIVERFSPYGKEIVRHNYSFLMSKPEMLKQYVLDKKADFKRALSLKEEPEEEEAIRKLRSLKAQIQQLSGQFVEEETREKNM